MGTSDANPEPNEPVPSGTPVEINPVDPTQEAPPTSDVDPSAGTSDPSAEATDPTAAGTSDAPSSEGTSADISAGPEENSQGVPPGSTPEQVAAEAAIQSGQNDPVTVPETRPQTFTQPDPSTQSDASKRAAAADPGPPTQEMYDRANSDEAKEAANEAGRTPNLLVGQRIVITGDHPEAGRMAHVVAIEYVDGINALLGNSATSEARFAEVEDYIVRTRDGRSDLLTVTPEQVKPLEPEQGWGRGQI